MDKKTKQANLDFLVDRLNNLKSIVFTNYKGLSAQDISNMRSLMKEKGGEYKVVKNTIALMAIKKSGKGDAQQFVSGPCAIAFLPEDPIGPLKILMNFSKEHEALVLKGGIIEGDIADNAKLKRISALPGKKELLATVLGGLKAPVSNLVNYLHQMIFSLICVINAVRSKSSEMTDAPLVRTSNGVNSIKNKPVPTGSGQDGGNKDAQEGSR